MRIIERGKRFKQRVENSIQKMEDNQDYWNRKQREDEKRYI